MDIEEGDFYAGIDTGDDFNILESPTMDYLLSVPPLPDYRRVYDIDVILPDGPMDSIILICRHKRLDGSCREVVKEYNMHQERWLD